MVLHPTTLWRVLAVALAAAASADGQTAVEWQQNGNGSWSNGSSWSSGSAPGNSERAALKKAVIVTVNGAADASVKGLDIGDAGATALFDFLNAGYVLRLGSSTSSWTAGKVEMRRAGGIAGNGVGNTLLNISQGVELLFSTENLTRSLEGVYVSNAGTIRNTTGTLLFSNSTVANLATGLIHADGAEIRIGNGTLMQNTGTLRASGSAGKLSIENSITTGNLGTVDLVNGGRAVITGTIDNTGATLNRPTGGSFQLAAGTVRNGSIAEAALTFTDAGGALENAALLGNVTLPASSWVNWLGGTTLTTPDATLKLGANSQLYWQQVATLDQVGITMDADSAIQLSGDNRELTLGAASVVSGDLSILSGSYAGTRLTNLGQMTHSGGNGYLQAATVTNSGTLIISGGTLALGSSTGNATFANARTGIIRLAGGDVTVTTGVTKPLLNEGTIQLQSGTLYTQDRVTNAATGWIGGSGVIHGDLLLAGGTVSPGNAGIGSLRLENGRITVTGAVTFAVDLAGSSSDQLLFHSPTGQIDLGAGLISLSLTLLGAPNADTTFTLVSLNSSTYGLTGHFSGLANSGDTITALFGGNAFTFSINYQPSFVSLAYNPVVVPEPSTYALMGGGLLFVAALHRRRRKRIRLTPSTPGCPTWRRRG